jgi:hypothetical protein
MPGPFIDKDKTIIADYFAKEMLKIIPNLIKNVGLT